MRNKYLEVCDEKDIEKFDSAEEAWFWYCRCEQMDSSRARHAIRQKIRPCETSDIFIVLKRLFQKGALRPAHLKVLSKYGYAQVPPHPHFGDSLKICSLWQEALKFLGFSLKEKGIIAV